jgi:MoxR-like ATPase
MNSLVPMNSLDAKTWQLAPEPPPEQERAKWWTRLPAAPDWLEPDPAGYAADGPLLDAANTALCLGKPLLLTGESGSGKTEFAHHLAWRLGLEHRGARGRPEYALRFDTKSESRARDLFYLIDQVQRFHQAQSKKGTVDPLVFMEFQALGRAIVYARPPDQLSKRLPEWQQHPGAPRRSVVLIDEIDKAPRDFPNDLLMEMEKMRFFIPEIRETVEAKPTLRPIVVITSNAEKTLPEPFLRRCVYFHIAFPDPKRLKLIVERRLPRLPADSFLVSDAIAVFSYLHELPLGSKKPGTAELLDFIHGLRARDFEATDRLAKGDERWRRVAAQTLLKTSRYEDTDEYWRGAEAAVPPEVRDDGVAPSLGFPPADHGGANN